MLVSRYHISKKIQGRNIVVNVWAGLHSPIHSPFHNIVVNVWAGPHNPIQLPPPQYCCKCLGRATQPHPTAPSTATSLKASQKRYLSISILSMMDGRTNGPTEGWPDQPMDQVSSCMVVMIYHLGHKYSESRYIS